MKGATMNTKNVSPSRAGLTAGCLVFIGSIIFVAFVLLLGPLFPGLPYGDMVNAASNIGSWGAIIIGVIVYIWVKMKNSA
jgi:hypothetical protein